MEITAGRKILFTLSPERQIVVAVHDPLLHESTVLEGYGAEDSSPEDDTRVINNLLRLRGLVAVPSLDPSHHVEQRWELEVQYIQ